MYHFIFISTPQLCTKQSKVCFKQTVSHLLFYTVANLQPFFETDFTVTFLLIDRVVNQYNHLKYDIGSQAFSSAKCTM